MADLPMFYLIDGHAVAYRQFFGLPVASFSTSAGELTNAVYGFTRVLLDIIQKDRPKYLAVSFDEGLSGREDIYPDYKGTRSKMDEDLNRQMERIFQVVEVLNIPILSLAGYEADDIIGTVIERYKSEPINFRIITGDRDLLQLLNDNVTVALPSRQGADTIYDTNAFIEKYAIRPDQLVDLKALMGDSSDNIPGVKGIGEKTATKFLQEYETLDNLYANIDQIKGANQRKLIEGKDLAYISQDLARIRRNVPIEITLERCGCGDFDAGKAIELFKELEFRTFTDRVRVDSSPQQLSLFGDQDVSVGKPKPITSSDERSATEFEITVINTPDLLDQLVATLNNAPYIVWDVETTGIDPTSVDLVGIALAVDEDQGFYIPVGHQHGTQLPLETVIKAIRPALTDPNIPKYAHNASYDLVVMARYGVDVAPVAFDTMIAEWVIDPVSKYLGLKNFASNYLDITMTEIKQLIGTGKNQLKMSQVDIERAAPYAGADVVVTARAVSNLKPRLAEKGLTELYETLELPLIPVIADMEQTGVTLAVGYLREMSKRLNEQIRELETEIHGLSGGYGDFNINSPKQLNDVLFGKLGLPTTGLKKTVHGYSTDVVTLELLKDQHPIIQYLLEYRELTKLLGTYVDALPELVNPYTGRLHTSYNQTGTSTGRLSSNNPNLQNIPIRTEVGREVRRAFVASEGHLLLSVDYSQIELRVLAHISEDETLLKAFAEDQDIHRATAAAVNRIPLEDVTYEQRSFAKRVNFGLIYGMGAHRLAQDSELNFDEAKRFIANYFKELPGVEKYIKETRQQALEAFKVTTLFNRTREFNTLRKVTNHNIREAELRAAINTPIQGSAADIMKRAMIDLHNALKDSPLQAKMILQVHDEIVLEVAEKDIEAVKALVVDLMENAYPLRVPLKANAEVGKNWRDME
jgi:DNA polymerase-1